MRITSSSDWRSSIAFDTPVLVAEVVPGEDTRCVVCGIDSAPRPRTELWAFKHHHPQHYDGYVRFYCHEHVPAVERREPVAAATAVRTAPRSPRRPASPRPRSVPAVERPRAICPDCFVEVPATGVCGVCGSSVA